MKKLALIITLLSAFGTANASESEITGHVVQNSAPVSKVCDALLLKNEQRCEHQDDYLVVAIVTRETDTAEYLEVEAINALIKKEELAIYLDKNVKATLDGASPLAHITEVIN